MTSCRREGLLGARPEERPDELGAARAAVPGETPKPGRKARVLKAAGVEVAG